MRSLVAGEPSSKVLPAWQPEYELAPTTISGAGDSVAEQRFASIGLSQILEPNTAKRKTKIFCTLGPACWTEEGLGDLLDSGMNVCRFNFSHGDHPGHQGVLDRVRKVMAEKGSHTATLLDTKGPEIRTAMLKGGEAIYLEKDQELTLVGVGDEYTTYEGFKDEKTGETVVGCSYAKLAQSVKPGNRILWADGSIVMEVLKIVDDKSVLCKCLNSNKLGQRKNGNLPGVKVDLPVLMPKDIDDLQNFACKNKMDYVAISFVQSGEDVQFVRRILDEAGGQNIQIISKIENEEGLVNFDEILKYTDGVMVARGDLGMEIPPEKVPLAQKWLITKCNLAGVFVVNATQMLESMCDNPLPTRAEMTDVANAVFDGADAVMLSGETANGIMPGNACSTMARIAAHAEAGSENTSYREITRDRSTAAGGADGVGYAACYLAAKSAASFVLCISDSFEVGAAISKFKPGVPVVVATADTAVARHTNCGYAQYPLVGPAGGTTDSLIAKAREMMGSLVGAGPVVVVDSSLSVTLV